MIDKRGERHRYGQHYTPTEVARLLAAFAVRSATDAVLDPSCGDGRLLREAIRLKKSLAATVVIFRTRDGDHFARDVFGVDRSVKAIRLAASTGACVSSADFFRIEPGAKLNCSEAMPSRLDAIIGNPPYIRQEVIGKRDKQQLAKRIERDRQLAPEIFWPRWSGRSDIYVYFFAHSIRFLKADGRLVFLTASSWLDAGYGQALREFLARNFRILAIIESAAESFFSDASINTAITVLEREPDEQARDANLVKFVQLTRPLSEILDHISIQYKINRSSQPGDAAVRFARSIEQADSSTTKETHRIRTVIQAELTGEKAAGKSARLEGRAHPETGWSKYLRASDIFFRVIERGSQRLKPLSDMARVRFGVKTGANDFFYVVDREERSRGAGETGRHGDGETRRRGDGERGFAASPRPPLAASVIARGAGEQERYRDSEARELSPQHPNSLPGVPGPQSASRPPAPLHVSTHRASRNMQQLGDVARVRRGLTTGANEFFYLKAINDEGEEGDGIRQSPPRVRVVEDGQGVRHPVEAEYLSPVIFSLKEISGIVIEPGQAEKLFFNCSSAKEELAGTAALEYITSGERAGYHLRPTCAGRDPWYGVARGMEPAPLIFPAKVGQRWVVALNRALCFEDKKLYGIFPQKGVDTMVLAALLNSTWARYYAEITCRQMTGAQAIADIDVAVAERILIADPRRLSATMKRNLKTALRRVARRRSLSVFEEVNLADRRELDLLVLEAIGFTDPSEREEALEELYAAVVALVRARLARSGKG
ncbi:MAG: N-6 DNA methylase [Blastocatellia bacterium]|nr:N-6 DNA methylase [Blastocatellia bacterium]